MTDINRSWARIGAFGDGALGRTITPLWGEEQEITFRRGAPTNDHGTFERSPQEVYWVTLGHIDYTHVRARMGHVDLATSAGVVQRQMIRVYVRLPDDPTQTPQSNDEMEWIDYAGVPRKVRVETVNWGGGTTDHLEIDAENFI